MNSPFGLVDFSATFQSRFRSVSRARNANYQGGGEHHALRGRAEVADLQYPGLRQNQYRDKLFKQFEKAPENRTSSAALMDAMKLTAAFNQAQVAYNATKDEKVEALKKVMDAREAKYKVEQ